MGTAKQLLPFGDQTLLQRAVASAMAVACGPVIVVLGARAEALRDTLRDGDVSIVINDAWATGIGSSIVAGVQVAAADPRVGGVLLCLADTPFVDATHLRALLAVRHAQPVPMVAARYGGAIGVPAYFSREMFPHLLALPAAQGCKGLLTSGLGPVGVVDCPEALCDLDTPADHQAALARYEREAGQIAARQG